jgi:hypothetical protein
VLSPEAIGDSIEFQVSSREGRMTLIAKSELKFENDLCRAVAARCSNTGTAGFVLANGNTLSN